MAGRATAVAARSTVATPIAVAEALHAALQATRTQTTAAVLDAGITGPQAATLWLLYEFKSMSPARLAEMQGSTAANITGIVQRLERDGLVVRKAHATDQRVKLVELTPEGEARTRQARKGFEKAMAHLFNGTLQADLDVVLRVLREVSKRGEAGSK
jgi:DNA-binding MarR family transcriptional regulator